MYALFHSMTVWLYVSIYIVWWPNPFFKIKYHITFTLLSHYFHFHNAWHTVLGLQFIIGITILYKNNIKPLYLKPFEMMSDSVSSKSIGLNNNEDIKKLLKTFESKDENYYFLVSKTITWSALICSFIICLILV
jgi:hypothetical protein